jgi:hypothetical protein
LHDAIEAARKSTLKRTSISKNNRKFLPRNSRINSAAFPESALPREFHGTLRIGPELYGKRLLAASAKYFLFFIYV